MKSIIIGFGEKFTPDDWTVFYIAVVLIGLILIAAIGIAIHAWKNRYQ